MHSTYAGYSLTGLEAPDVDELLELLAGPAWHADAACREHPDVNFFPERGEHAKPALDVCAGCLVAGECRTWALTQTRDLHGVWGGTTGRSRQQIAAAARPEKPAALPAPAPTPTVRHCSGCHVVISHQRRALCPSCSGRLVDLADAGHRQADIARMLGVSRFVVNRALAS